MAPSHGPGAQRDHVAHHEAQERRGDEARPDGERQVRVARAHLLAVDERRRIAIGGILAVPVFGGHGREAHAARRAWVAHAHARLAY